MYTLFFVPQMSIVDLAGAERSDRTHNSGKRLKEAMKINTSLMQLGRCLEILRQNQQRPQNPQPVPFATRTLRVCSRTI
jgi:hypothetical protein